MRRCRHRRHHSRLRRLLAAALGIVLLATSALAGESRDQQRCLNTLNRAGAQIARDQAKAGAACIDRLARGETSAAASADGCALDDAAGRVARRVQNLRAKDAALCKLADGTLPDFGYAGSAAVAAAARDESAGIVTDLFGPASGREIVRRGADLRGARCQLAVLLATDRLFGALWTQALGVIKDVLHGGSGASTREVAVASATALRDAIVAQVEAPRAGAITGASRLLATTQKQCGATPAALAGLFPARCAGSTTPAGLARCAEALARKRFYRALGAFDRLSIGCDLVDNGLADLSCDAADLYEHVLNRTGYGPDAYTRARIAALGVRGYIEEQLHPEQIPDRALDALLTRFPSLGMDFNQLRISYPGGAIGSTQPRIGDVLKELQRAKVLRAIASRRQLQEVLVDFWFNHFNVLAVDRRAYDISPYERIAIRPYVLGRFRDLVLAVARSPGMGDYLDNRHNRVDGINENYAREFLELETVGLDGGYTEHDVVDVARAFTGWREDWFSADGFLFEPAWHDFRPKTILSILQLSGAGGYQDGVGVIDLVTSRRSTAELVSRKLVMRFVADDPPASLVSAAAATFVSSGGDLRAVMTTILTSSEFLDRPEYRKSKVKRPLHFVASLARATGADPARLRVEDLPNVIRDMGEELYKAPPPTGYPDASENWAGPGALLLRINEVARAATRGGGYQFDYPIAGGAAPAIVDALIDMLFVAGVSDATRATAIAFVDALPPATEQQRVEQAAAFLLSSPEFLQH